MPHCISRAHGSLKHAENTRVRRLGDIEAQEAVSGLSHAKRIARRKDDVFGERAPGNVRCIQPFGQLAPEKHSAARLDPWLDAERLQAGACLAHRTRQALSQPLHVLSIRAVFQHAENKFRRQTSAAE